jgi:AcrR family transcriptional regulator
VRRDAQTCALCKNVLVSTIEIAEPGLRERKRLATRRAIQIAVLDLVGERGLERVTVDEISRAADISPRTFFNYFASKEDAILGDAPELPDGEILDRFVADSSRSIIDGLASVLIDAAERSVHDLELVQRRQEILQQYPQMFAKRMATMRRFEDEVGALVVRRLLHDDPTLSESSAVVRDKARLITLVAFSAMRHAWTCWAGKDAAPQLPEQFAESFTQLKALFATG